MSVGSLVASFTAGKRTVEDGQAQMRIESTIEPVLLGEIAVDLLVSTLKYLWVVPVIVL